MLKYVFYSVFIFGIYGAGILVYNEFSQGNICPKLLNIPACYIILACLVIPFLAHVFKKDNIIYFTGTGIAWSIAFYASIMQISGVIECPKTSAGIPMCYISFAIFTLLIVLKIKEFKKVK